MGFKENIRGVKGILFQVTDAARDRIVTTDQNKGTPGRLDNDIPFGLDSSGSSQRQVYPREIVTLPGSLFPSSPTLRLSINEDSLMQDVGAPTKEKDDVSPRVESNSEEGDTQKPHIRYVSPLLNFGRELSQGILRGWTPNGSGAYTLDEARTPHRRTQGHQEK